MKFSGPPEDALAAQLDMLGLDYEREVRFHPTRKWRLDFVVADKVAVEVEGGIWKRGGGGHSHPMHIERDIEKYNALSIMGYTLIRVMPDKHIQTGKAVEWILEAVK